MTEGLNSVRFTERLDNDIPSGTVKSRVAAFFSAAVAVAERDAMIEIIEIGRAKAVSRRALYETMLQSYLILGFPRMISAAVVLAEGWPEVHAADAADCIKIDGHQVHYDEGIDLCRQVYGDSFEKLRSRIMGISPDIFHLMITEGYGKIYQRPGLSAVDRELANVSALVIENRHSQLHSHIRGALNVGTDRALVAAVIEDVGPEAGPGYYEASAIMKQLENL